MFICSITDKELGAIVKYFDKTNTNLIDCTEFLKYFLAISNTEKNKDYLKVLEHRKKNDDVLKREANEMAVGQWAKIEADIDWNCTKTDEDSALGKLAKAALKYNKSSTVAGSAMSIFDCQYLTPGMI